MSDAAKSLRRHLLGGLQPPTPEATLANLGRRPGRKSKHPSEPSVQFNLRLPASVKKRIRLLAARDNVSMSDIVLRGVDLYEDKHGKLPVL